MQAVILAAGRGTRMGALTEKMPKPMLVVAGKTLLEHKFDILPNDVDEIILVVGYKGEVIQNKFGTHYQGKKLSYVVQHSLDGTAGALWRVRPLLKNRFLVMMGDDIYSKIDIENCCKEEWALLVDRVHGKRSSGLVEFGVGNVITSVVEGEHDAEDWWSGTNMFVLDTRIFSCDPVPKSPDSDEFGLPQTVLAASRAQGTPLIAVKASSWIQITSPEDITLAEELLGKII